MTRQAVTIRPGPVLHVWQDGQEVAALPLSRSAALWLASALLAEVARVSDGLREDEGQP